MKKTLMLIAAVIFLAACSPAATPTPEPTPVPPTPTPIPPTPTPEWVLPGWTLVWQDEFDGETIDLEKWTFDIGNGVSGWGNFEKQFYSDRPENARIEDGMLVIEALNERYITRSYSSARLKTEGLHNFQYGRIEARIRIPTGQGIWSAFWMLGSQHPDVEWPQSGEIDIMENIGSEPHNIHGTVHGPGYSRGDGVGGSYGFPRTQMVSDNFHIFAIEWEENEIRWFIDDLNYFTLTPEDVPGEWVYNQPFFIILNVAVGGSWPGSPDETTVFPQTMHVDWVRVYERTE